MPRSCAPTISIGCCFSFSRRALNLAPAALVLGNPFPRELAALDVGQRLLHGLARCVADNLLTARQIAVLRRVRDRIAHPGQPAFVDQVDDQLHLVQALEVGDLRRVAGLDQRFESLLDQRRQPATEHGLLAEQVAFGFLLESRLQNARARRADAVRIGQRKFVRAPAGILLNRDQGRHPAAFGIHAPDQVSGTLGSDHHHIYVRRVERWS